MVRAWMVASIVGLLVSPEAWSQAPQFKWTAGQTLVYKVSQTTSFTEKVGDKTSETIAKLDLLKKWSIDAVDAAGVATLTMSIDKLRMETKTPAGETKLFDSEAKEKSTPAMIDEMSKFVGGPLHVVRLDPRGQLVEVKESKFAWASRIAADLPFKIVLPAIPLAVDGAWDRQYQIKLDAQNGVGESYAATQKLTCKAINGSLATVGVTTVIAGLPDAPNDQIPLLPWQPSGDVVFDLANGRLKTVRYKWSKEFAGHHGGDGKYIFSNTYVEELQ